MSLSLNWDMNNVNGVITNDTYISGALFSGIDRKPVIPEIPNYLQFIYQETQNIFLIALEGDSTYRPMTIDERTAIQTLAANWIQEEGEEGNPNADQLAEIKLSELQKDFSTETTDAMRIVAPYEPVTWTAQEVEARAYLLDNATPTPIISALILGRNINTETIDSLAIKIVEKADAYVNYYVALGKLQGLSTQVEDARFLQDKSAISLIVW